MIVVWVLGYLGCQATKQQTTPDVCGLSETGLTELEEAYITITENVGSSPTEQVLPEDTNGTLNMGLNPYVFPIVSGEKTRKKRGIG